MTFIAITAILGLLGIGAAIGYLVGANDKKTELNYLLGDSILETIKWKRDSEYLSTVLAEEALHNEELSTHLSELQNDVKAYHARVNRMLDEKAILRIELDILESECDDHFEEDDRRKLHNTVQATLTRKWGAYKSANRTTRTLSSKSNQD
jgi:hypothetical protein